MALSSQGVHRQRWIRSDFIRRKIQEIMGKARVTDDDVSYVHSVCTDNILDPRKRDFRIHRRCDGLILTHQSEGGEQRVDCCILAPQKANNVMQAFYFTRDVGLACLSCGTIRYLLETNVRNWLSLRSVREDKTGEIFLRQSVGARTPTSP